MLFKNRKDAGEKLAEILLSFLKGDKNDYLLIFLPRGGVEIAKEISKKLKIPYFPLVVKKLAPLNNEEFGFGAMNPDGEIIFDKAYMTYLGVDKNELKLIEEKVFNEIQKKIQKYAFGKLPNVKNKVVILVDDGVATGYTALASALWLKKHGAKKIILAVPVCPLDIKEKLKNYFDEIICLYEAANFQAVGQFYEDFHQIKDEEYFDIIGK